MGGLARIVQESTTEAQRAQKGHEGSKNQFLPCCRVLTHGNKCLVVSVVSVVEIFWVALHPVVPPGKTGLPNLQARLQNLKLYVHFSRRIRSRGAR
jgi:hypothetical protein